MNQSVNLKKYYLTIAFAFATLFFFSAKYFYGPVSILDRFVAAIVFPIVKIQSKISAPIQDYFRERSDNKNLLIKLSELQRQAEELSKENIELKASLNYLKDTSELDRFRKRYQDYVCTAQIVLRQIDAVGQYIFVDQGLRSGVEENMIAVYRNSLVGRVDKVFGGYSRVVLVTDKNCKISAICSGTKLSGIYEGVGSLENGELMHIDHLQNPQVDDLVISSGEGLIYPQGFSLGRIQEIYNQGVSYKILVKPLYDLDKIKYCYLIKSKLNS